MRILMSVMSFLLLLVSIAGSSQASERADQNVMSFCPGSNDEVVRYVRSKLARVSANAGADSGEELEVELGQAYDSHPCELVLEGSSSGLTDEQIARFITALPVDYVDQSCKRAAKLKERIHSLQMVPIARRTKLEDIVGQSLKRDERECKAQRSAG